MSTQNDDKTKYIRHAALIALIGNATIAMLLFIGGAISHSGALIGNGIDSSTDVLISILTLVVAGIISKPADAKHPWGHKRAEAIATTFLSFIIFFAGAQLIISSISNLIFNEQQFIPSAFAIIVTIISIIGKSLLALSQHILGKRAGSSMIKANAKNMASDVLLSAGVLVGLVVSTLVGSGYPDTILAILIGLWIIKTSIGIFLEVSLELMDGNSNKEMYRIIIDVVDSVEGAYNPHRARIRCIGGFWDIDFDIEVDPECTVSEAHIIASHIEQEIKNRIENVLDIMIHVEPYGDKGEEGYGLSEEEMRNGE
jgi:cation diffusion facilitator family transporter